MLGLATGLLFVELDFLDPKEYPANERIAEVKYAVDAVSAIGDLEFQSNLNEILHQHQAGRFSRASAAPLRLVLDDTHKQLEGLDLEGAVGAVAPKDRRVI